LNLERLYQNEPEDCKDLDEQAKIILPTEQVIQAILDFVLIADLENINWEMEKIEQKNNHFLPFMS